MSLLKRYKVSAKDDRTFDGIVFDSEVEMKFYRDVVLYKYNNGEIKSYELQKKYILQPSYTTSKGKRVLPIVYIADFYIVTNDDKEIVIDIKGCPDDIARLKRKLFEYKYPKLDYMWVVYSKVDGGWVEYDYAKSEKRKRKKERQKGKEVK